MNKNAKKSNKSKAKASMTVPVKETKQKMSLAGGVPCLKDLVAPPAFDRSDPSFIRVGNKFARSFMIAGYPKNVFVTWLDALFNSEDDLDMAIHINPTDERAALDELTNKITQFQAQLTTELERGSNRNVTRLQSQIDELVSERAKIEQNYINMFGVQIDMNLYCDSAEALNKQSQLMESSMRGRKVKIMPLYFQQDEGYKSCLPFGKSWLPRNYRNFSSEALTACFPFYNAEVSHKDGIFLGINSQTGTPIYIDLYDRRLLNSSNIAVFGQSGSGKTFFTSLLTMRSVLNGVRTVIIDPEGDYTSVTRAMGGTLITIAPNNSACCPNPLDLEDEDEVNEDGTPTGRRVVQVKEKVADVLNLIGVMVGGELTQEQRSLLSYTIAAVYEDAGFNEDPNSLYDDQAILEDDVFTHNGHKKRMPQISDLIHKLEEVTQSERNRCLVPVMNSLRMFSADGVYGLFDHQTPPELQNLKDAPVITFNVKQLEENVLRPIGMYVALSWTWEKFAKRNVKIRKRVLVDEAWMMMSKNMSGHEYTAAFLENMSRRIRKRNGGLCVSSQNFREFSDNPQGKAVLTNSAVNVFLKQTNTDIDEVQKLFKLSDGERDYLLTARKGCFLLRAGVDSTIGYAYPTSYEKVLIERGTVADLDRRR